MSPGNFRLDHVDQRSIVHCWLEGAGPGTTHGLGQLHSVKQKLLHIIPARIRNRYGLGIGVFLLYVCFLSDYDLYTTLKLRHQLHNMRSEHERLAEGDHEHIGRS